MTRGELLLWPRVNRWGVPRREELKKHIDLCTTLFPEEDTCEVWAHVMTESRAAGRPITAANAWVAAAARQWISRSSPRIIAILNISTVSR